jgi:predicted transposase/invertase (TIGR01784 family)
LIKDFQQPEVREAIELVRESAFSQEELAAYEDYWDSVRVERSMISDALETGHAEGALQARQEIGKSMLAQGFSREQIKKITGVSE